MKRPTLVVFGDDWGRHPSSVQHLISHLLDDFSVTWINTIGTRRLRLDHTTISRGQEKLRQWIVKNRMEDVANGPQILNPIMWPSFRTRFARTINRWLLCRTLHQQGLIEGSSTIITTVPIVSDLVERVPDARWIYYCVDDFASWPGLDGDTLRKMEASLVQAAHEIVAAGENLAVRIRALGREPRILTHGVDVEYWATTDGAIPSPEFFSLERPLVLFWGLVDQRLDLTFLRSLSERLHQGTIVLVGPQQAPDSGLTTLLRTTLLGPMHFDQLPKAAACADVLIMPYRDLPVTRAMQPLKLKEYMATGKPVVVRRLPATHEWGDCITETDSAAEFADAVLRHLATGISDAQRQARQRLANEGWAAKAQSMRRWIGATTI
jgi:hypothetical protein